MLGIMGGPCHEFDVLWSHVEIADLLADSIGEEEQARALEQAVHGLDTEDERQLQALLAAGLEASYAVEREVHYPSSVGQNLSERQRCDIVLRAREPGGKEDDPFWLEVKVAYQFGAGGARHRGYSAQWTRALLSDLKKIEGETAIKHAALVLIVFNESEEILNKDLQLFENLLTRSGARLGFRQVRTLAIADRIGHRLCTVALWPM